MAILASLIFTGAWLTLEMTGRRRSGRLPGSLLELYAVASQRGAARLGISPQVPALIFAATSYFFFALWESALRSLLDRTPAWPWLSVGFCLAVWTLWRRQQQPSLSREGSLTQVDLILLVLSWSVLLGSGWTTLLLPWVIWRGRFLKRSNSGGTAF